MNDLEGRRAVVTGGTRGIGLAIARSLAESGCRLLLAGLDDRATVEDSCAELRRHGSGELLHVDVDLAEPEQARRVIPAAMDRFGGVDILVNNAGIQHVAPVDRFDEHTFERVMAINLLAPFRLIKQALPSMRVNGFGRIINIASVHGLVASTDKSAYIAAKHGLVGLTKAVALETATDPITCNAICPGLVRTAIIEAQLEARASLEARSVEEVIPEFLAEKQPSLSFVDPANLGALAVFLCSRAAEQITGTSIPVDGGWTAR